MGSTTSGCLSTGIAFAVLLRHLNAFEMSGTQIQEFRLFMEAEIPLNQEMSQKVHMHSNTARARHLAAPDHHHGAD
jgi:hypothetical protein